MKNKKNSQEEDLIEELLNDMFGCESYLDYPLWMESLARKIISCGWVKNG